jgi:hypothetical protein
MWYLPAHRVEESKGNVMLDKPYMVSPPNTYGSEKIPIPAERMIYCYHPDPADPMQAYAPIRACMQNVRVGESIVTCQEQMFNNGIYPGLAIITGDIIDPNGKNLGKAQMDRFQIGELMMRIEQLHKGPHKFNKPLILDRAIDDVKMITNKPQEMDWTQSYDCNTDAIWASIGTPPVIAGRTKDANRATALVADESFISNVLMPRTSMLSFVMNDRLLPIFNESEENLVMWIEDPVSSDRDMSLKENTLLINKRGMTVDEYRQYLGRPPLPNGKGEVLISPATDIIEPLYDEDDEAVSYREEFIEDQAQAGKPTDKPEEQEGKPRKPRQNPPPSADETATGKAFSQQVTSFLKVHGRLERTFRKDLEKFFNAQAKYAASQIEKKVPAEQIFNPREWDEGLRKLAEPHMMKSAVAGATQQWSLHSPEEASANLRFPSKVNVLIELPLAVINAIKNYLWEVFNFGVWSNINNTTSQRIADAISDSIEAGETIRERAISVNNALKSQTPARSLMIARTETTGALAAGAMVSIDELNRQGANLAIAWLATDDSHVRPTHWAANGQQQDAKGEFTVGGFKCRFPCDPALPAQERCNCRCGTYAVV